MMRTDSEFTAAKAKEEKVTKYIMQHGFLSACSPVEISAVQYQVRGVDLSCCVNGKDYYIDLKLKNANCLSSNVPATPSQRWSVEILREKSGVQLDGWFCSPDQMTNVYCFLDAEGDTFDDISQVSCTFFSKASMKKLIEDSTGVSLEQMHEDAVSLLGSSKSWIGYGNGLGLKKSMPDKKARSWAVNFCFGRDFIKRISKTTAI